MILLRAVEGNQDVFNAVAVFPPELSSTVLSTERRSLSSVRMPLVQASSDVLPKLKARSALFPLHVVFAKKNSTKNLSALLT